MQYKTDANGYLLWDGPSKEYFRKKVNPCKDVTKISSNKFLRDRLSKMKGRAISKGLEFDLDEEWLSGKMSLTHCEVTGIEFSGKGLASPWAMSIDRTNNNVGYTKDNCKAVVWIYNCCKKDFTEDDILQMSYRLMNRELSKDYHEKDHNEARASEACRKGRNEVSRQSSRAGQEEHEESGSL